MKALRCGLLDAILYLFTISILGVALIEHVVDTIALNDIVVDTAIFGIEEHLWLALKTSKVFVGISIISDEALSAITCALKGEINHVFLSLLVVDSLWCPYPVSIAKMLSVVVF